MHGGGAKSVSFTTNGLLLTDENIKRVIDSGVTSICISVDGVGKNYERIRQGSNFEKVMHNIRRLHEIREEMGSKTPTIYLGFVMMRSNIEQLPELIKMTAPYVDIYGMGHPLCFSKEITAEHMNNYPELGAKVMAEAQELCRSLGKGIMMRPFSPSAGGCLEPWSKPYIGIDGTVYPCCVIGGNHGVEVLKEYYGDAEFEVRLKDYALGNLAEQPLSEIWNSKKLGRFRREAAKYFVESMGKEWTNEKYVEFLKVEGKDGVHCKICPFRFNCAC